MRKKLRPKLYAVEYGCGYIRYRLVYPDGGIRYWEESYASDYYSCKSRPNSRKAALRACAKYDKEVLESKTGMRYICTL